MKNKISFTSVLKSKGGRQLNLSSIESQSRQPRLIDLYQEFQINPNKTYTLQLNAFRITAQKSRNSSISMLKSNQTSEDPEMNLDQWVQQTRQNYQSFTRGPIQKSAKPIFPFQQEVSQSRRTRSNFNKHQIYPPPEQQENSYSPNLLMQNSQNYEPLNESKKNYHRNTQKPSLHYQSQQIHQLHPQKTSKQKPQNQSIKPQQFLVSEQLKPKSHFPNMEDHDYKKLQEEFQRLKQQKITELCMQTKKSVKKQKLEQVISKALDNIHEDIEEMAGQIIMKRKMDAQMKKLPSQQEVSEQMLISGCNDYQEELNLNQSLESENNYGEEKRKQEMRNMIKGYISGIQEAKSQGKPSTSFNSSKGQSKNESQYRQIEYNQMRTDHENDLQEPSFNYHSNTFSNQLNDYNTSKQNQSFGEKIQNTAKHSIPESVGYSFANSNMICEHSFNKEVMDHNQFHQSQQNHFLKTHVNPPVYEPENSDNEQQQRISLPNIEEVKSDCGDFMNQQLQSSEAIEYKRNKMQNLTLDVTGNNIKNIESVHYEPPAESYSYQGFQQNKQRKDLFKNFEQKSGELSGLQNRNLKTHFRKESNITERDQILKQQIIPSHQDQKFVSKTFSSYLSGEMRSQYGQAVKDTPKSSNNQSYSSKQSGFGYKIQSTNKFSPSVNKVSVQKNTGISKHQNQEQSFHSISSPREINFAIINNSNSSQRLVNSKVKHEKFMNQSSQLSLNNSINQNTTRLEGPSSKNIHQLQSKNKFSINSPMNKIDEIILNQEKLQSQTIITEFNGFNEKAQPNSQLNKQPSSNSYAISSPIGNYKMNDSIMKTTTHIQQNLPHNHNYACAKSISSKVEGSLNQPFKEEQNSILSMQPLKLSVQKQSYVQNIPSLSKQQHNLISYPNKKINQSHEIYQTTIEASKVSHFEKPVISSNINNGRTFLQSLHEKQSIQIEMSPDYNKQVSQQKKSFVAQTFRPTTITIQQNLKSPVMENESQSISSSNKTSITKITLRSSDRNNNPTSPKVISLSINQFPQKAQKNPAIVTQNKENVFEKLTIKDSKHFQTSTDIKVNLTSSTNNQSMKFGQNTNIQSHVDMNSKENNNTMNNCNFTNGVKTQFSTYQKPLIPMLTQKREPLLKLSKNFGNTTTQQSMNVKKSIGESIKTKVHPISSLASSKGYSMAANVKQSIRNVKQSIGNESDMDFDLELD